MKDMKLAAIIPRYRELNRQYKKVIAQGGVYFNEQKAVTDFYRDNKNVQELESSIISLVMDGDRETLAMLLRSLRLEVEANLRLYLANQMFFDCQDTEKVCLIYANRFDRHIDGQLKVTREYGRDLTKAGNSLETVQFREHTREEEELLERQYDLRNKEYKEQKTKLDNLYALQKQAREEGYGYVTNRFFDIMRLGEDILDITEKYIMPKEDTEEMPEEVPSLVTLFPEELTAAVHKACNGEQFEEMSEVCFHANLNLHPCERKLKVRPREKVRVCYLVSLLGEKLTKDKREEWRTAMLELLGIDTDYYKSKYREPVSDFPSDSNQKFAKEMAAIF